MVLSKNDGRNGTDKVLNVMLVKDYASGIKGPSLARKYGIPQYIVYRIINDSKVWKAAGMNRRRISPVCYTKIHRLLDRIDREKFISLQSIYHTDTEIGVVLGGIPARFIAEHRIFLGIPSALRYSPAIRKQIIREYFNGATGLELSAKYGMSSSRIYVIVKNHLDFNSDEADSTITTRLSDDSQVINNEPSPHIRMQFMDNS